MVAAGPGRAGRALALSGRYGVGRMEMGHAPARSDAARGLRGIEGHTPVSRLRSIATLANANQATQVSWAMYVTQPLAE
jgi:hypothetical protein